MKKLNCLVITNYNYEFCGGVENFNRMLYRSFPNINFFEFPIFTKEVYCDIEFKNLTKVEISQNIPWLLDYDNWPKKIFGSRALLIFKRLWALKKCSNQTGKKLEKIIKNNNIDIILLSGTSFFCKKFFKKYNRKIYFIQHDHICTINTNYYYDNAKKLFIHYKKNFKQKIAHRYYSYDFPNIINNFICNDNESLKLFLEWYPNKNVYCAPLASKFEPEYTTTATKKYDFISPIRNAEKKNPDKVWTIFKCLDRKGLIIGDEHGNSSWGNIEKKEAISDINEVKQMYSKSKFMFLASDYEGFSLAACEALSLGLPCILPNTFPTAKYHVGENNERGFVYDFYDTTENIVRSIDDYIKTVNYAKVSKKCVEFAKQNFTTEIFKKNWSKIFNEACK